MRLTRLVPIALSGLVLLAAFLVPPKALAHAKLIRSRPNAFETLAETPVSVELFWFNERLEDEFNSIEVVDVAGRMVEEGHARVNPQQRTNLFVQLRKLSPGSYVVHWKILSVDGHTARGRFIFSVK
jgi:methionine-rich copper-binding protein CopC